MKVFYVTKKQVREFIENSLKRFDSLVIFRDEIERVINELSPEDKAQLKFYNKVRAEIGKQS